MKDHIVDGVLTTNLYVKHENSDTGMKSVSVRLNLPTAGGAVDSARLSDTDVLNFLHSLRISPSGAGAQALVKVRIDPKAEIFSSRVAAISGLA